MALPRSQRQMKSASPPKTNIWGHSQSDLGVLPQSKCQRPNQPVTTRLSAKVSSFTVDTPLTTVNINIQGDSVIQLPSLDSDNLLSLLHLMPVGIFLVNSDNRIIWVNKTLCDQVGVEARQLIGHMRSELPGTNIFPISEIIARQHINNPNNETLFNFNYISKKLQSEFDDITEIGCLVERSRYRGRKTNKAGSF